MIHRLSQFLVLATLALLFAGGLVTSTDSGLAVPDWPLSYGSLLPPMVGGIRFEHTHRLIATTVGLLTVILTFCIGKKEKQASLRWLAIASLGAVVLQGILGGMTVLYKLPAPVSIAHACIGPLFFCLVVSLCALTSPDWRSNPNGFDSEEAAASFRKLSIGAASLTFLQMLLGAVIRHTGRGIWPHALLAFIIFFFTGFLVSRSLNPSADEKWILRPAIFLGLLVIFQFFLGIAAFLFTQVEGIPPGIGHVIFPTLHQTLGAVILATTVVLTIRSRKEAGIPV